MFCPLPILTNVCYLIVLAVEHYCTHTVHSGPWEMHKLHTQVSNLTPPAIIPNHFTIQNITSLSEECLVTANADKLLDN